MEMQRLRVSEKNQKPDWTNSRSGGLTGFCVTYDGNESSDYKEFI